jgi:hypothetical protein
MVDVIYGKEDYQFAFRNTKYNSEGKAVVTKDDEWNDETEWDEVFEQKLEMCQKKLNPS